jgi:hypothetical protein
LWNLEQILPVSSNSQEHTGTIIHLLHFYSQLPFQYFTQIDFSLLAAQSLVKLGAGPVVSTNLVPTGAGNPKITKQPGKSGTRRAR